MNKVSCEVIRDLLPLYEDGVASEKTQQTVREHLSTCPACREELRKLRVPVSLPPDEDGEVWARIEQRRAELKRKRRIKWAAAVSVLAAIALFCLWYTRPQKLTKILDAGQAANLAASLSDKSPIIADNGWVKSNIDTWLLNDVNAGDPAMEEILSMLENTTCRASLLSLIPRDSYSSTGARGFLLLGIVWDDQSYSGFDLNSNGELTMGSDIGWDIYHVDPAVFDALAAVIQAYGTFQE